MTLFTATLLPANGAAFRVHLEAESLHDAFDRIALFAAGVYAASGRHTEITALAKASRPRDSIALTDNEALRKALNKVKPNV